MSKCFISICKVKRKETLQVRATIVHMLPKAIVKTSATNNRAPKQWSTRMKIIFKAENIIEAEIVKGMLIASDIDAHVSGFYLQVVVGEIAPTDLANVLVSDEDYHRAGELVREYDENQPIQDSESMPGDGGGAGINNRVRLTIIVIFAITVLGYWVVI